MTVASYSPSEVDACLARIRAISPPVVAIALDRYRGRMRLTMEKERKRDNTYLDDLQIAKRRIGVFLGCTADQAGDILREIETLVSLNPAGAWVLDPDAQEPKVLSATSAVGRNAEARAFLEDVRTSLADLAPAVSTIRSSTFSKGIAAGTVRTRFFLRVFDGQGNELAALDTAHFSTHIAASLLDGGEFDEINRDRMAHWAHQMQVRIEDMPQVLQDLLLVFVTLRLTEVGLR